MVGRERCGCGRAVCQPLGEVVLAAVGDSNYKITAEALRVYAPQRARPAAHRPVLACMAHSNMRARKRKCDSMNSNEHRLACAHTA